MKRLSLSANGSLPFRLKIFLNTACLLAALNFSPTLALSAPLVVTNSARSPLIANVIKLQNAKVAPDVIKAYVQNSPVRTRIDPEQIIALQKASVPAEIIKAIIDRSQPQLSTRPASPPAPPATRPPAPVPRRQSPYTVGSAGWPMPPYPPTDAAISYPGYSPFFFPSFSPGWFGLISFNNSFPTYINGYPVYSGVGLAPVTGSATFNNSFPTYVNGIPVYAGSYYW